MEWGTQGPKHKLALATCAYITYASRGHSESEGNASDRLKNKEPTEGLSVWPAFSVELFTDRMSVSGVILFFFFFLGWAL